LKNRGAFLKKKLAKKEHLQGQKKMGRLQKILDMFSMKKKTRGDRRTKVLRLTRKDWTLLALLKKV